MDALEALVLGIIQGITEWLPVSSSGHLVISEELLGLSAGENLVFDLVVHLGTLFAVIIYFRNELWRIVAAFLKRGQPKGSPEHDLRVLGGLLLVGTLPVAVAGVLFNDAIEKVFDIRYVGMALIANSIMLFTFEKVWSSGSRKNARLVDAVVIGVFQAIAIIPGISRSGSTIGGGMLRGLEKEAAAVFAFLLSIPALSGAFAYGLVTLDKYDTALDTSLIGFFSAMLVGLMSIRYLLKAVRSGKLWVFSAYCAAIGLAVVVLTI